MSVGSEEAGEEVKVNKIEGFLNKGKNPLAENDAVHAQNQKIYIQCNLHIDKVRSRALIRTALKNQFKCQGCGTQTVTMRFCCSPQEMFKFDKLPIV